MGRHGILEPEQCASITRFAAEYLYEYCAKNGIHYVVTGSSGGLDSAVTLGLAQRACQIAADNGFRLTSVGLIMPCHSSDDSVRLGRQAIEKFRAEEIMIDLGSAFDANLALVQNTDAQIGHLLEATGGAKPMIHWEWSERVAQGNIKARLRMMYGTYHVARMLNGMVLSTDNLSELWMAFWTICGDVGDFGMIQNLLKGLELYDLADYLGVPEGIINAKPDDGLNVGKGDEDQLGASYPVVDRVMINLIHQGFDPNGDLGQLENLPSVEGVDQSVVRKLAERCLKGAYKRRGTINLSRTALGLHQIETMDLDTVNRFFE